MAIRGSTVAAVVSLSVWRRLTLRTMAETPIFAGGRDLPAHRDKGMTILLRQGDSGW